MLVLVAVAATENTPNVHEDAVKADTVVPIVLDETRRVSLYGT